MQIEQSFDLPQSPAAAWPAFADIELLVACLPGASLTGPAVEGELPLRFDVKLGPIAAGFVGSGRVVLDDAARAGRFEGQAVDKRSNSRVKGVAAFSLQAQGEGTRVAIDVDYSLSGTLAQFSRGGIVRELASALTAQFAANLAARLQSDPQPAIARRSAGSERTEAGASDPASVRAEPAEAPLAGAGSSTNLARTEVAAPRPCGADPAPDRAEPVEPSLTGTAPSIGSGRAGVHPAVVPLNAWSLVKHVIAARWRRLFSRREQPVR